MDDNTPCLYKPCPALASPKSVFGYCPVHDAVAMNFETRVQARAGKLTENLKAFAIELEKGLLPKAM